MRTIGRSFESEERILKYLDAFLISIDSDLTSDSFSSWSQTQDHLTSGVRRSRMRIVRNMCLYRKRNDPSCFIPDITNFPAEHQPVQVYIFSEAEIVRLVEATHSLHRTSKSPLCPEVYCLAVVLFYTTGLRRRELVRLNIDDYDPREHTLFVRASKFHKSRLLPLSRDGFREIDVYLKIRSAKGLSMSAESPLLWSRPGDNNRYRGSSIWRMFSHLFRTAGIHKPNGSFPRVHDLRHTFAVHALLRWYRSGVDVQSKLPLLAAYMGHVSIVSTQKYLHFIEEIAACAGERFEKCCGRLVDSSADREESAL
jgi:integrase